MDTSADVATYFCHNNTPKDKEGPKKKKRISKTQPRWMVE